MSLRMYGLSNGIFGKNTSPAVASKPKPNIFDTTELSIKAGPLLGERPAHIANASSTETEDPAQSYTPLKDTSSQKTVTPSKQEVKGLPGSIESPAHITQNTQQINTLLKKIEEDLIGYQYHQMTLFFRNAGGEVEPPTDYNVEGEEVESQFDYMALEDSHISTPVRSFSKS